MKWISVIPIRAGSKGIKNKNIRPIFGKPLYEYTIDAAIAAGAHKVFISTNIKEVLLKQFGKNIITIKRAEILCRDNTPMSDVILDFLELGQGANIKDDQIIVLMQATSPLRKTEDLIKALKKFSTSKKFDLMMSVTQTPNNPLKYGLIQDGIFENISNPEFCFANRQYLPELFRPTGSFYIFTAGWYRKNRSFTTSLTGAYKIPKNQSLDIDSPEDLKKFKKVLIAKKRKKN